MEMIKRSGDAVRAYEVHSGEVTDGYVEVTPFMGMIVVALDQEGVLGAVRVSVEQARALGNALLVLASTDIVEHDVLSEISQQLTREVQLKK